MKKFTSLLIGCSLALAGAALAQQPEEQPSLNKGKNAAEKAQTTEAKPGANTAKPEAPAGQPKQHGMKGDRAGAKGQNTEATPKSEKTAGAETNVSGEPGAATPGAKQHGKGKNAPNAKAKASSNEATSAAASATPAAGEAGRGKHARGANAMASPSITPATAAATSATPAVTASASAAPSVATVNPPNNRHVNAGAAAKKPEPQKLQQIKEQHVNFRAQPRPDKVPAVTFQQNYRVQGSDRWEGAQYEVFRSYHPERHDQAFYRSHFSRVELIGGGYYYFNNGYWYPAWGYSSSQEYYAYDAPIYVGHRSEPPDRVIADVQAELQEMGYYTGEVDGLLGPLTREALTGFQSEQGITATAVIDEPTLDALGMG